MPGSALIHAHHHVECAHCRWRDLPTNTQLQAADWLLRLLRPGMTLAARAHTARHCTICYCLGWHPGIDSQTQRSVQFTQLPALHPWSHPAQAGQLADENRSTWFDICSSSLAQPLEYTLLLKLSDIQLLLKKGHSFPHSPSRTLAISMLDRSIQ